MLGRIRRILFHHNALTEAKTRLLNNAALWIAERVKPAQWSRRVEIRRLSIDAAVTGLLRGVAEGAALAAEIRGEEVGRRRKHLTDWLTLVHEQDIDRLRADVVSGRPPRAPSDDSKKN